jgi:hypothetical protein
MKQVSAPSGFVLAVLIGCCLVCSIRVARGADDKPQHLRLDIEKLSLFKNGLGFVVSSAELPKDAQTVRIGQLPVPSFGTFWVGYPKEVRLRSLVTSMEEVQKQVPVQSIGELLQMNVGRRVLVHTSDRDIDGIILAGAAPAEMREPADPYVMSPRQSRDPNEPYLGLARSGNILLMRTDKGIVALNPGSVLHAEFADGEPITTAQFKQRRPSIKMMLEKPAGGEKISVSYLARGVTWVPSYLIDLSDPKTARFSAHAIVINELTDLNNVKLQLVTGFPNVKFGEILSPVAKSQTLAEFLQVLSGPGGRQDATNYRLTQQSVLANAPGGYGGDESALVPGYTAPTEGEAAEDLYFYPVKSLTLKKDETAWIPLFTAEMPYKHIYTWRISDFVDPDDHYRAERESQDRKAGEEIWHSCRLVSTLDMPLTTAATEFVTNGEFTGQDVCSYTPPRAETTIRINKALNLVAEQAEIEVERKRDVSVIRGYRYDLVKVRGELKIRNKLVRPVSVEITKGLSGEVIESVPKATDTKTAKGLQKVNPKHVLTWLIDLKPEEEQKLSYQYQVYIRE